MKKIAYLHTFVMATALFALFGATPPSAPQNPLNPLLPPPTNVIVLTNITAVYTNVAVKSPTLDFQNVTIYGGSNVFKNSLMVAWDKNPEADLGGYILSYGRVSAAETNTYRTLPYVTVVVFYSMFSTNYTYWFYVQATNTAGLVSDPSNVILVTPNS